MKTAAIRLPILLLFLSFLLAFQTGCRRERGCDDPLAVNWDPDADVNDGSCIYTGRVSFWTNGDGSCGNIDVYIAGAFSGTIENYFPTGIPECNQVGTLTLELEPGIYPYEAIDDCGTWTNSITIVSEGCLIQKLAQ